jgi:hypothetical protein
MDDTFRGGRSRPVPSAATLFAAVLGIAATLALTPAAFAQAPSVKMERFGWSFFRFTSPNGKVILTNPFITGNPDAAVKLDDITRADVMP